MTTHRHSLTAKMLAIAPGETIWIEEEVPNGRVTRLERDVQTRMYRTPALKGMKFTTTRLYAVRHDPTRVIFLYGFNQEHD